MKNISRYVILCILFLSIRVNAQWSEVSPVTGVTYNDVAYSNGNLFTAQSGNGVHHSTDDGATWNPINNGITDLNITSLKIVGDILFAGSNGGMVFISTDNGANWSQAGLLGSNTSQVKSIVASGAYVFAGTFSNGIYRSSDNGTTWDSTSFPATHQVRSIVVSGTNLFAAAYDAGVYISTDDGASWTLVNNGLTNVSMTGLAASENSLYASTNGAPSVFVTTDNGANWSAVGGYSQFSGWGPYAQSVATFGENNVFVGTFLGGVYLSSDRGENWLPINDGFAGNPLVGSMITADSKYIYIVESMLGVPYNSPGGLWRRNLTDVIVMPPAPPVLVSPENSAVDLQTTLTLTWNSSASATGYQAQVSLDSSFASNIVLNDSALTDTIDNITGLGNSAIYYWRVRAYNSGGFSDYTAPNTFSTIMQVPELPSLVSPESNAVNRPWNETFVCTKAEGAAQYHWQVSSDVNFLNFVVNDTTVETTRLISLEGGVKYYWRVRAVNPGGSSEFAGPDSLTVMAVPSTAPELVLPENNSTFQPADGLILVWSSAAGASGYEVQVSEAESFATFSVEDSTADTSYVVNSLKNLQKYYWRVRGYNEGGSGSFSEVDFFTTIIAVPAIPQPVSPTFRATNVLVNPVFKWNTAALAEKYQIQVATASDIYSSGDSAGVFMSANVVFDTTLTDTTIQLPFELQPLVKYYWHVRGIDTAGAGAYSNSPMYTFTTTSTTSVDELSGIPEEFALYSNYPNPFNPSTKIKYNLPESQMVSLRVYNVLGQEVATLVNMQQNAGYYEVTFNADQLSSGIYLYILKTESYNSTHKMLLLK